MVIENQDSIWRDGFNANARYTKDLEDMLKRIVEAYAPGLGTIFGLIIEAKALLDRTDYTES